MFTNVALLYNYQRTISLILPAVRGRGHITVTPHSATIHWFYYSKYSGRDVVDVCELMDLSHSVTGFSKQIILGGNQRCNRARDV